jgi:3-deoxy-7-phosphoheptulonate synthase
MIIEMRTGATKEEIERTLSQLSQRGIAGQISYGEERIVIGVFEAQLRAEMEDWCTQLPGVERTRRIRTPYKLASREFQPLPTVVCVGEVEFGGRDIVVIAGPCSVESEEQIFRAAEGVLAAGAQLLRGGAFKPRTSPYAFRGLGVRGLELLARAREATGLGIVTEVMAPGDVALVGQYADVLQIGARNMQNYPLLEAVGRERLPVLLKRGPSATIEEWLLAAEYVLAQGNRHVILCERGIRTFETQTRNTFDLNAIAYAKQVTHLPVIADPSHATGDRRLVAPLSLAAIACGADGLMIEAHPNPQQALSDGDQSLDLPQLEQLMGRLPYVAQAVGRTFNGIESLEDARMLVLERTPVRLDACV